MAGIGISAVFPAVEKDSARRGAADQAHSGKNGTRDDRADQEPDNAQAEPGDVILNAACKRTVVRADLPRYGICVGGLLGL